MNKTVNADETVAPEQGWRFRRTVPPYPKYIVQSKCPRGAEIGWVFFASCSPSPARAIWLQSATWIRGTGPQTWPGGAQIYCTHLSVVIISSLMAIFLTN
jgi:hypothetical protein